MSHVTRAITFGTWLGKKKKSICYLIRCKLSVASLWFSALANQQKEFVCSVDIGATESFLHGGELPTLIIQSTGHAVHIFINGQLSGMSLSTVWPINFHERVSDMQNLIYWIPGSAFGTRQNRRFTYKGKINLHSGTNRIALLSVAVGLPVSILFLIHC